MAAWEVEVEEKAAWEVKERQLWRGTVGAVWPCGSVVVCAVCLCGSGTLGVGEVRDLRVRTKK